MAFADRYTGKALYATLGSTVLTADYQTLTTKREFGKAEKTAGADTHASYIPTYGDTTVELEVLKKSGTAGTSEWSSLVSYLGAAADGTLTWGPEGTASGKAKHVTTGFIEEMETEVPFDDMVTLKIKFQCNTAIVDSTY